MRLAAMLWYTWQVCWHASSPRNSAFSPSIDELARRYGLVDDWEPGGVTIQVACNDNMRALPFLYLLTDDAQQVVCFPALSSFWLPAVHP